MHGSGSGSRGGEEGERGALRDAGRWARQQQRRRKPGAQKVLGDAEGSGEHIPAGCGTSPRGQAFHNPPQRGVILTTLFASSVALCCRQIELVFSGAARPALSRAPSQPPVLVPGLGCSLWQRRVPFPPCLRLAAPGSVRPRPCHPQSPGISVCDVPSSPRHPGLLQ